MKKFWIIFGLALVFFSLTDARAQVSAKNVLERAGAVVEKLEEQDAQVLFIQVDNISKEQIATQSYALEPGSTYAIVAVGDQDRIQDIDLAVADSDGDIVGKDNDESNLAIVKIKPRVKETFKIAVKGYKMTRSDGFYAIIICRLD